jgi:hypothetical protein
MINRKSIELIKMTETIEMIEVIEAIELIEMINQRGFKKTINLTKIKNMSKKEK